MFDKLKTIAMEKLEKAKLENKVDEQLIEILELINKKPDYFTTSSCYGRIYLMDVNNNKQESKFLAKWHRKVSFDELKKALDENDGNVWFRSEPLILHISCRGIKAAKKILEIKTRLIKRGGIFQVSDDRVQIELIGTSRIDAPVKENRKILVDDNYLKKLVETANQKFEKNEMVWKKLEKEFTQL